MSVGPMVGNSIQSLSGKCRSRFLIRLLYEITLVAHRVWSDDSLSDSEKSEALKWMNEINCCILHAYGNPGHHLSQLYRTLESHSEHVGILPMVISSAWQSAAEWVTEARYRM